MTSNDPSDTLGAQVHWVNFKGKIEIKSKKNTDHMLTQCSEILFGGFISDPFSHSLPHMKLIYILTENHPIIRDFEIGTLLNVERFIDLRRQLQYMNPI